MHTTPIRSHSGFSLIELSIVLVILGLLAGGVLAGQNLIQAAKLRGTVAQMTDLSSAVNAFRDRYLGLPGDITNATKFWGYAGTANDSTCKTNSGAAQVTGGTCDGNGDRMVEASNGGTLTSDPDNSAFNYERAQFFVQLGLAGLGPTYDGTNNLDTGYPSIKLHPANGMIVTGKWIDNLSNLPMKTMTTDSLYLYMGVVNPSLLGNNWAFNEGGIFTPIETWDMDSKIDDGLPLTGKLLAEGFNQPCVTGSASQADGGVAASIVNTYNVNNTAVTTVGNFACNIMYSLR